MIKQIKNITAFIIAFVLLSGSNFAYAVVHGDCIVDSQNHITCEMDCCEDAPCNDNEPGSTNIIKDENRSCCEVHIEQSLEQDITIPVTVKKPELTGSLNNNFYNSETVNRSSGSVNIIQKFQTSDILLFTSILRI